MARVPEALLELYFPGAFLEPKRGSASTVQEDTELQSVRGYRVPRGGLLLLWTLDRL